MIMLSILMQWIEMLERLGAPLHNPGNILKWNSSKTYLVELQDKGKGKTRRRSWTIAVKTLISGVALPKTVIVPKGSSEEEMKELMEGAGLQDKEVTPSPLQSHLVDHHDYCLPLDKLHPHPVGLCHNASSQLVVKPVIGADGVRTVRITAGQGVPR